MAAILLDANAAIMHGRAFPDRVRNYQDTENDLILPASVKRELVDDVLDNDLAPENHLQSAHAIQQLISDGQLTVREAKYEQYGDVVDEARRRIADENLPEHAVKADQYIPALVCELAREGDVTLVTADKKLRAVTRDIADRHELIEHVSMRDPLTVL